MIDRTLDMERCIRISTSLSDLDHLNTSGKLKQASALSTMGYHRCALDALSTFTLLGKFSFCCCRVHVRHVPDSPVLAQATNYRDDITAVDLLRAILQPCVHFFLHEQQITPVALNYEMLRTYVPSVDHLGKIIQLPYFYEWGVVDGHFLQRLLQYLNRTALGQTSHATKNVKIMINC